MDLAGVPGSTDRINIYDSDSDSKPTAIPCRNNAILSVDYKLSIILGRTTRRLGREAVCKQRSLKICISQRRQTGRI